MASHYDFPFNHKRHLAALNLHPQHITDFQRLVKDLRFGSQFQFLIAEYSDTTYRDQLIQRINEVLITEGLHVTQLALSQKQFTDFSLLETALRHLAAKSKAIHVIDNDNWFNNRRWQVFNIRREAIARDVPVRLLFWLNSDAINSLTKQAPDLWAWRAGVFNFTVNETPRIPLPTPYSEPVDGRSLPARSRRIAELSAYLNSKSPPPSEIALPLWDELADLYFMLGKLDEALRIRQQDELPVYEKLGDVREAAITRGKIADILQARGKLDEALRIYKQDVLPVLEKTDSASAIIAKEKIASLQVLLATKSDADLPK